MANGALTLKYFLLFIYDPKNKYQMFSPGERTAGLPSKQGRLILCLLLGPKELKWKCRSSGHLDSGDPLMTLYWGTGVPSSCPVLWVVCFWATWEYLKWQCIEALVSATDCTSATSNVCTRGTR